MEAYCVKCREKREIQEPVADFNKAGAPVTKGTCGVCGTKMNRMGRTEAHEGLTPPEREARPKKTVKRNGNLVIVESPAKARTVGRYLGKGYTVRASVGHVRDLLRSQLSVDVDNNFQPKYRVPNDKRDIVKELKKDAKTSSQVYLATDPDREGEAIAWHLQEALDLEAERTKRVVFHEITEGAIHHAFDEPRGIDMDLVDAQQARRVLDRLVGYSLSPLLWQKVRGRLSAGRVQSVALRLIVEREREIENFVSEEYWSIEALVKQVAHPKNDSFRVKLQKINNEDFTLSDKETVDGVLADMEKAFYFVSSVKRGERKRKPSAPFTTSTLQQDASRKLGFTSRKTMRVAQQLYEGIELEDGNQTGLITYMRTDSTNVSDIAQAEARELILKRYGEQFLPESAPVYKTKAKGAQEAHEAIRPTSAMRTPKKLKAALSRDQYRLYQLIWQRFMASQMAPAIFSTLSVDVDGKADQQYLLRASGSILKFAGFLEVYEEGKDEDSKNGEDNIPIPADIKEGESLNLEKLLPDQHFTQPPPRYTEASLVRTMEENGIGRPSTYAPTISTIQARGYVYREEKRLYPTETGVLVNDLLVQYFNDLINASFTAQMEEDLDEISLGKREWHAVVDEFYQRFKPDLDHAHEDMPEEKLEPEKVGRDCPECSNELVIRWGRYGKFISCSDFPNCRYTEPWLEKIGVHCPECESGEIVKRKTKKGRTFYGCSNYPECQFTSWKQPLPAPCPHCGGTLVYNNKREASCLKCEESTLLENLPELQIETADQ